MRIADKMNYDQVTSNLAKNRSDMADLQNQSATMKRVNKPSDDPLAASRVLQTKSEVVGGQQFLKSVNQAKTFLEYSDQSLAELTEVMTRAKELALGQANDASANHISRQATASEIDQLFSQSVQIGNRKMADRFLFGGFKTTRPPFNIEGKYFGDDGEIKISVQKEGSVAMNIPGSRIFLGRDTKAPANAGPDPAQSLKMEENPSEQVESRGPASIPATGRALSMGGKDSKEQMTSSADDAASAWSSGVNIFAVLRDLSTGLRANDKEGVQESLTRLDQGLEQVVLSRAQLGARVSTLNAANESLQKGQVDAKTLQSGLEDADTFGLVSDINKTESTLKASLTTSGKLIQPSLLDFLR